MGWLVRKFWDVVLICALIALLAGAAVMHQIAGTGGNALGQGASGGFTFLGAIGGGWRDAQAVSDAIEQDRADKAAAAAKKAAAKKKAANP
jgi:hypothetical protein